MKALVDSSFLIALANPRDVNHTRCVDFVRRTTVDYFVPSVVIPEVTHMLFQRVGHHALRQFVFQLRNPLWHLLQLETDDLSRAHALLEQYVDAQLDFVDCAIVSIAERLSIETVLTLDRRDFSIVRPAHAPSITILPE